MNNIYCKDEEKTEKLGHALGTLLSDGDVLCLSGDLGAGKTCFAKAVATALGVSPSDVNSPTFSIMNIYKGRTLEIKHFDLYRLNSAEELEDIGFSEFVGNKGITLIEWGELFQEELPREYLSVKIVKEETGRRIFLEAYGSHYKELCEKVWTLVNAGN